MSWNEHLDDKILYAKKHNIKVKHKSQDNGVLSSIIWLPSCILHIGKEGYILDSCSLFTVFRI